MHSWTGLPTDAIANEVVGESRHPGNYKRTWLNVLTPSAHLTFSGEEALKLRANVTRWDPIFNFTIWDRDRREQEGFA